MNILFRIFLALFLLPVIVFAENISSTLTTEQDAIIKQLPVYDEESYSQSSQSSTEEVYIKENKRMRCIKYHYLILLEMRD